MLSCSWYICLFCYTFGKLPKNKTCVACGDHKIWSATYWYLSINGLEITRRGLMGYIFCSEQALKLWISWVQQGSSSQFWVSCKCCMARCLLYSILKYPICNRESGIQKPSCSSPPVTWLHANITILGPHWYFTMQRTHRVADSAGHSCSALWTW